MNEESDALRGLCEDGPRDGADMEAQDAIRRANRLCGIGAAGRSAWAATTFAGKRLVGNGLGDTGGGETWDDALAELSRKHLARLERLARLDAQQGEESSRIAAWLIGAGIVLACAAALWWAAQ